MKYQVRLNTSGSTFLFGEYETEEEALTALDDAADTVLSSPMQFVRVVPVDSDRRKYINKNLLLEAVVEQVPISEDIEESEGISDDSSEEV